MKHRSPAAIAFVGSAGVLTGAAHAQEQVIASLPFVSGMQTAGPTACDYEPPNDDRDWWVIEDFVLSQPVRLTRFQSLGTIFQASTFVHDVNARVYSGWPPEGGTVVASSTPGAGSVSPIVPFQSQTFTTLFPQAYLPAGSYYLVWNAATLTNSDQVPVWWHHPGPHAVGGGGTANAFRWNPGGFFPWPGGVSPVPLTLQGTGQSGVNFVLFGDVVECYPDCNGDAQLTVTDFGCFQTKFVAADPYADCDGNGQLTVADFGCFQTAFVAGCP